MGDVEWLCLFVLAAIGLWLYARMKETNDV